jgi:hypothetical protein
MVRQVKRLIGGLFGLMAVTAVAGALYQFIASVRDLRKDPPPD